jgi:arabinogalactan oligomer/maltooligosaccharide transport system permease protein
MNEKVKKILIDFSAYLFLIIFTTLTVYPVLNVISISLRPADKLLSTSLSIIPDGASLNSYISLFTQTPFLRWLFNSTFVSVVVMITGVTLASTAGYALSRFKFFGKKAVMIGIFDNADVSSYDAFATTLYYAYKTQTSQ